MARRVLERASSVRRRLLGLRKMSRKPSQIMDSNPKIEEDTSSAWSRRSRRVERPEANDRLTRPTPHPQHSLARKLNLRLEPPVCKFSPLGSTHSSIG